MTDFDYECWWELHVRNAKREVLSGQEQVEYTAGLAFLDSQDEDILVDFQALREDLEVYERKFQMLSERFYELYSNGVEPADDAWVLDWADWAGTYKVFRRRQEAMRTL